MTTPGKAARTAATQAKMNSCAVGVVDVARAVQEIEDLASLGNGTEQRVIAARSFLLLVEAHGGPFRVPRRGLHGAVEV